MAKEQDVVVIQDPVLLKVKVAIPMIYRRIEATRALYDLLLEYSRDNGPATYIKNHYTEGEINELRTFQKKHLLRRIQEEAIKAGFTEFAIDVDKVDIAMKEP
jgi:hypothetical protein